VAARIHQFQPDIVHVHNFFPTLTPSVYDACRSAGVPVVQTLHNYRLMCANALLFRQGKVCTECLGHTFPLAAIRHSCYRDSILGTAAVTAMIGIHRIRHTWANRVSHFIALTEFARNLFAAQAGIPQEKIAVKPNAAPDPGMGDGCGGYALYVGRFSSEKGIETVLESARNGKLGIPLKIAGSGPLQQMVEEAQIPGVVECLGQQDAAEVRRLMQHARVLLIPSVCYEGLPMVVPEAFGAGLPIIASRIGSLQTLIEDGGNGFLVEPGNAAELAEAVRRIAANERLESDLRRRARQAYETLYRPDANLRILLQVYEMACQDAWHSAGG
jgi:glycosyltransferase involved in cell wall biosynthesis